MADVQAMITKRAERYKDKLHQKQFALQVNNPPTRIIQGELYRKTGSSVYYPFWHGFDGIGGKIGNGCAYDVSYAAGKYRRELEDRGLLPKLNARKIDPMSGMAIKGAC
jgi:hypothetical protein